MYSRNIINSFTAQNTVRNHMLELSKISGFKKLKSARSFLHLPDQAMYDFSHQLKQCILHSEPEISIQGVYTLIVMSQKRGWMQQMMIPQIVDRLLELEHDEFQFEFMSRIYFSQTIQKQLVNFVRTYFQTNQFKLKKFVLILIKLYQSQTKRLSYNAYISRNQDNLSQMINLTVTTSLSYPKYSQNLQTYFHFLEAKVSFFTILITTKKSPINMEQTILNIMKTLYEIVIQYDQNQKIIETNEPNQKFKSDYYIQVQYQVSRILIQLLNTGLDFIFNQNLKDILQILSNRICTFQFSQMVKCMVQKCIQKSFIEINKFKSNKIVQKGLFITLFNNIFNYICCFSVDSLESQMQCIAIQALFSIMQRYPLGRFLMSIQQGQNREQINVYCKNIFKVIEMYYKTKESLGSQDYITNLNSIIGQEIEHLAQLQKQDRDDESFVKINFILFALNKQLTYSVASRRLFFQTQRFKMCFSLCLRLILHQKCMVQASEFLFQLLKRYFIDQESLNLQIIERNPLQRAHQYLLKILDFFQLNYQHTVILQEESFQIILEAIIKFSKEYLTICSFDILKQVLRMFEYLNNTPLLKHAASLFRYIMTLNFEPNYNVYEVELFGDIILDLSAIQGQSFILQCYLILIEKFSHRHELLKYIQVKQKYFLEINKTSNKDDEFNYECRHRTQIMLISDNKNAKQIADAFQLLLHCQEDLTTMTILKLLKYLQSSFSNPQMNPQITCELVDMYIKKCIEVFFSLYEKPEFGKNLIQKMDCLVRVAKLLILALDKQKSDKILKEVDFQQVYRYFAKIFTVFQGLSMNEGQTAFNKARFRATNYNLGKCIMFVLGLLLERFNFETKDCLIFQSYTKMTRQMSNALENKSDCIISSEERLQLKAMDLLFHGQNYEIIWPLIQNSIVKNKVRRYPR